MNILYILGLTSHDNFMHFSAHVGMSFTLFILFSRFTKYPGSMAFLLGLSYKFIEGINLNVPQDFLVSMLRNLIGIGIAYYITYKPNDNTKDFVEIELNSMEKAMNEKNLDIVLRLLPVFLTDVKNLLRKKL